jgi:methyltransferase (TIGR00027 family)
MDPQFSRRPRAAMVARARFIEDLVREEGVAQYVLLGAGLDTFAFRKPPAGLQIFEVERPLPQEWKRRRLAELGWAIPGELHFVPVDFEAGVSWLDSLSAAGFDRTRPALVASAGVSMYLTHEAIVAMLREAATLAPGSTFVMTFLLPMEMLAAEERAGMETARRGAQAGGTPFISFFAPDEMLALAHAAGFRQAWHVSPAELAEQYFSGRSDGLAPAATGEQILVAKIQ